MKTQETEIFEEDCYNINPLIGLGIEKVFDFGGNVGNFVRRAAELNCPIDSYEPFEPQFSRLKEVCDSIPNATAIKKAITHNGRNGFKEKWPMTEQDRISPIGVGSEKFESVSIHDFLLESNCFFKIDIEGGELELLPFLKMIAQKNWISIEFHGKKQAHEDFLDGLNYTTYGNRDDIFVARINPMSLAC